MPQLIYNYLNLFISSAFPDFSQAFPLWHKLCVCVCVRVCVCVFSLLFFYFRESVSGVGEQRESNRENPKLAPHLTWNPMQGSIPQPWDHDLSRNQESDAQTTESPRHPAPVLVLSMSSVPHLKVSCYSCRNVLTSVFPLRSEQCPFSSIPVV